LKEIFWRASVEAKHREEAARQRTEQQRQQHEQRQRWEDLRALFHQAFEAAQLHAKSPLDRNRLRKVTERIMALGKGIVAERQGGLLDTLPLPGRLTDSVYLPLRFAIQLLREARDCQRRKVRAALVALPGHPSLQDYYLWFGVLADRMCGYADVMPGVPGKTVESPPLERLTPSDCREVERGLGISILESSPSAGQSSRAVPNQPCSEDFPELTHELNDQLSERQYNILEALYRLKAFTCADLQTTAAIARNAEGKYANPESFKLPLKQLRYRGLVQTKPGRGGGIWLTPAGIALIQRVRPLSDERRGCLPFSPPLPFSERFSAS
jgi:hypothetical protein